jgi:predicted TIM-barrel fold metal-dependent hydrolase
MNWICAKLYPTISPFTGNSRLNIPEALMKQPLKSLPVLDCHIHYGHPDFMPGLIAIMDKNLIQQFNIVCTPHRSRLSLGPDALHLKAHYPERVYVFGGLNISTLFIARENCGTLFSNYVETLIGMGCDGIKMIEGKPEMRKNLSVPSFDSPAYEPYWAKMETTGLPIIFHVNDPEEFWDSARVPEWAKQQGWFYGDGSYIDNEAQYTEILHVMRRHPGIKVVFAHFFFLSAQLERLAGYLDEFPNMHIDLTPGIEMYHNFSKAPAQVREFFIKYQDRILFGTDIGAKALLATPELGIEASESELRLQLVRTFLETDGPFSPESEQGFLFSKFSGAFQGINLPDDVLEKIYYINFKRLAGNRPRPINHAAIIGECQRLIAMIPAMGAAQPGVPGDTTIAEMVMAYFESLPN